MIARLIEFIRVATVDNWPLTACGILGLVGTYLLLPRPHRSRLKLGLALTLLSLVGTARFLIWHEGLDPESILFYSFSGIAIIAGGLLVIQQNPVHAALSFALVVLSTSGLFLLQAAPFLMAATIIVYAGAIVVTFLFVIMLAQQAGLSSADQRSREPLLSSIAGFGLMAILIFLLNRTYEVRSLDAISERAAEAAELDSIAAIKELLGDEEAFFAGFQHQAEMVRGSPDRGLLLEEIANARVNWLEWKRSGNVASIRIALSQLAKTASQIESTYGLAIPHEMIGQQLSALSIPPTELLTPGENVAPLGRTLFSDYLLAVELAGTLLLVATVGAIAIAGRGKELLR